jgi:hypothetical protein
MHLLLLVLVGVLRGRRRHARRSSSRRCRVDDGCVQGRAQLRRPALVCTCCCCCCWHAPWQHLLVALRMVVVLLWQRLWVIRHGQLP